MPLTRYQIRNEYSLADPELYRAADKDDPEALLEGVAMAGLVGVLRQLGDLAEFAVEIFHNLHEEVMATSARGHGLMVRVQQLEAEFPLMEKAFLSQTSHSSFFYNAGIDWHPNLHMDQNLITRGDLPRFVMDSYEECRGPPRLFHLDKFDVAGAGACLKRYTDPSFYKVEKSSSGRANFEVHREKKNRKAKKKGSRWKNGETPEVLQTSHAKLHQLFLEEQVGNGITDPACHVKLRRRLNGFPFDLKSGKSYMEKFLKTTSPEHKVVHEISVNSSLKLPSNITSDSGLEILDISMVNPDNESMQRKRSPCSSLSIEGTVLRQSKDESSLDSTDGRALAVPEPGPIFEADSISSTLHKVVDEKEIVVDGEKKVEDNVVAYQSDDNASEIDNYVDALTTMESEMETDSEFRAKNNLSILNVEKQGTDSYAIEEHIHTHFSDSQSIGNSTASDDWNGLAKNNISSFSCSDTPSISAENTSLDGDLSAKVFPSSEICEGEIIHKSSEGLSIDQEAPVTQSPEYVVYGGASIEVGVIPNDRSESGEPCSSSCLTDSALKLLPVDPGTVLTEGTLVGPGPDEASYNCDKLDPGFIDSEENGTYLGDNLHSTSDLFGAPSQRGDDLPPIMYNQNHFVNELDDEDPNVFSDASIHLSNTLVALENKRNENLLEDVLQTEYEENGFIKDCVDSQISSPPVISHTEENPWGSALPEVETCDSDFKSDAIVSVVDDALPPAGEMASNLTPIVDSPATQNFIKLPIAEMTDDVMPSELDSAQGGVSFSREKNVDVAFSKANGEEIGEITPKMDLLGSDAAALEFPSELSKSSDHALLSEIHVCSDEIEIETPQSEASIAAVPCLDDDVHEVDVSSPSEDPRKLHEECFSSLEDSDRNEMDTNQACIAENHEESSNQEQENKLAAASPDLESVHCSTVSCNHSVSENVNNVLNSSLASEAENNLHLDDKSIVPSSLGNSCPDSESSSSEKAGLIQNTVDASSVSNEEAVASPYPDSMLCRTVSCDHSDSELLNNVPDSSLATEAENNLHLHDATTVPSSSEHSGQEQANLIKKSEDVSSLPVHHFAELSISSGQNVDLQADQLDPESLHVTEAISELFSQSEHIKSLDDMDHERRFDAASESCPANLPSHPSVSELLPQSASQKLEVSEQVTDPLSSFFPGFGLLPEATQITLEEMPPMPPLPPVQWRIGKLQQASLAESKAMQHNMGPFPSLFPSTVEGKAQLGYPALKGEIIQPTNPFLPLTSVNDENVQPVYEHLAGNMMLSGHFSLPMPTTVNDGNSKDTFLTSNRTQLVNPFLTLPPAYGEKPQHGLHAGKGVTLQPISNSSCALGFSHESSSEPHQVVPETNLHDEKIEHSSVILEGKMLNPRNTILPPPTMEDGQAQHVFSTSEGEMAWSFIEDGKSNGIRPTKLPRPRSPLIDAVAAHDKSKLRKVTERIRPQIQEVDERDSLLEQIRTKSFSLKPAVVTRPTIQGPKTNLRVAAILEKANSIRQALAGSDEDDDEDSWSDS